MAHPIAPSPHQHISLAKDLPPKMQMGSAKQIRRLCGTKRQNKKGETHLYISTSLKLK
jgi:hypothetical protein